MYAFSEEVKELKYRFSGDVKIIHSSECLVSLADQVQASDHQRGVVLAEVQPFTLDLLVIQEDQIRLLNRYALKDPSDSLEGHLPNHHVRSKKVIGLSYGF